MKLTFDGWARSVHSHGHDVTPITTLGGSSRTRKAGEPFEWGKKLSTVGKVKTLGLTGDFSVRLSLDISDVEGLMQSLARTHLQEAVKMAASMQAAAILALTVKD